MQSNREKERYSHSKLLKLEFSDERHCYGHSRDVSLTGLFFVPEEALPEVEVGEEGRLQLTSGEDVHLFSCQVIRKTHEGVALRITDYPARFGMAISHDVLHSMLARMRSRESVRNADSEPQE
ncbi:MAG: PilZ domain-containing protein [Magnetococcus sp. YQC-3]